VKIDVGEANPCKRGVLDALYQTRLQNFYTPNIVDGDLV
jgi:hypothetical protein